MMRMLVPFIAALYVGAARFAAADNVVQFYGHTCDLAWRDCTGSATFNQQKCCECTYDCGQERSAGGWVNSDQAVECVLQINFEANRRLEDDVCKDQGVYAKPRQARGPMHMQTLADDQNPHIKKPDVACMEAAAKCAPGYTNYAALSAEARADAAANCCKAMSECGQVEGDLQDKAISVGYTSLEVLDYIFDADRMPWPAFGLPGGPAQFCEALLTGSKACKADATWGKHCTAATGDSAVSGMTKITQAGGDAAINLRSATDACRRVAKRCTDNDEACTTCAVVCHNAATLADSLRLTDTEKNDMNAALQSCQSKLPAEESDPLKLPTTMRASDGSCSSIHTDCVVPANVKPSADRSVVNCEGPCEYNYRTCYQCEKVCARSTTEARKDGTEKVVSVALGSVAVVATAVLTGPLSGIVIIAGVASGAGATFIAFLSASHDVSQLVHLGAACTAVIAQNFNV